MPKDLSTNCETSRICLLPGMTADYPVYRRLAPLLTNASIVSFIEPLPNESQAANPPGGMRLDDWTGELHDFADNAALLANLDLVVSVDRSMAHLAGALGHPVWQLAPHVTDWRWPLGAKTAPGIRRCGSFASPARAAGPKRSHAWQIAWAATASSSATARPLPAGRRAGSGRTRAGW